MPLQPGTPNGPTAPSHWALHVDRCDHQGFLKFLKLQRHKREKLVNTRMLKHYGTMGHSLAEDTANPPAPYIKKRNPQSLRG